MIKLSQRRRMLAAPILAWLVACTDSSGPSTPPPASVLGCYDLTVSTWSGLHESPDPPPVVILTDSIGSYLLESGRPLVRPWPDPAAMPFDMAWWERPSEGRLNLVFTQGGFIGIRIGLQWAGSRWSGQAEAFTDVAPPVEATTLALLVPTPCS
jgi:hypothetical protein